MKYQILSTFLCITAIYGPTVTEGRLIDPRFPDYIVEPLVDCPTEGFFEHPRNCSWFYRCHVSENITDLGHFRRDYFECAPGTAFSSELNICDFEVYENCNPDFCDTCGSVKVDYCDTYEVCPDPSNKSNKISLVLCENPIYDCENCTDKSPCHGGDWLISLSKRRQNHVIQRQSSLHVCFPSPYSPEVQCRVCTDCSISTSGCFNHTGNECIQAMTLCSATNICGGCPDVDVCGEGEFYSLDDGSCYSSYSVNECFLLCTRCAPTTSDCQNYVVCPNGGNKAILNLCSDASRYCSGCIPLPACAVEMYYSAEEDKCYPSPDSSDMKCSVSTPEPPVPCTDCSISTSDCRLFDVCPDGENHVNLTLCSFAGNVCQPCQSTQNICQDGQLYAMEDEKCYGNPETMACPKCDDCYISTSRCQAVDVCPDGKSKVLLTLCPTAKRVCDPCGLEDNVCPRGQQYSMETATCYPPPTDSSMRCSPQSHIKRDSSVPNKVVSEKKSYPALECSARNLFPQDLWIKEKFCKNYQPCSDGSGLPSGVIELCTNYFECVYRVTDHGWNAVKNKCTKNKLFSFEAEACVPEPRNICRVF